MMAIRRGVTLLALTLAAGSALGQDSGTTVLVVERAPASKFLVDPKDEALGRALGMVPARLSELPREIPDMPPEASGIINLLLTAAARPATLTLRYDADNPSGAGFGYGLVVSIQTRDQKEADQIQSHVNAMIVAHEVPMESAPSERWDTMLAMPTPAGPVSYGPREGASGWSWDIIFGNVTDPDSGKVHLPEPVEGTTTVIRGRLDFAGFTPMAQMASGFAAGNPQALQAIEGFEAMGLIGEEAVKMSFQMGYTDEESRSVTVWEGARRYMEAWNMSEEPLSRAELGAIPADAAWAWMGKADLSWAQHMIDQAVMNSPEAAQGFDQFAQMTGVDPRDLLGTLGGTMAMYASDATGGGSLGSIVGLVRFTDREAFMAAQEKLRAFANSMADQAPMGPGYIRVTPWNDGGTEFFSLRFPGLPVPLELTYAATDQWLIFGLTPQGVVAAARQATGKGDGGLASNAGFKAGLPAGKHVSVSYFDTQRAMHSGYPLVSLLGSAIANAVRSPGDAQDGREPGMIVPVFHDLTKGARAQVQASYWRGDDLVSETRGDRSMLVNATAAAGVIVQVAPLIAIPAMGAAMENHREFGLRDGVRPELWALAALAPSLLPSAPSPAVAMNAWSPWIVSPRPARLAPAR